jgi:hypothetical protein
LARCHDRLGRSNGGVDAGDDSVDLGFDGDKFRQDFLGGIAIAEGGARLRWRYAGQARPAVISRRFFLRVPADAAARDAD